jgi:hypothetical protein
MKKDKKIMTINKDINFIENSIEPRNIYDKSQGFIIKDKAIHEWFELSYANYLVIPRSIFQSMPNEWQTKFVKLLNEIEEHEELICPKEGIYEVRLKNDKNKVIHDYFKDYERGRRRLI